jgi:hypothetical protein
MSDHAIPQLLISLVWLIPSVSVSVIAIVVALARWHRHPQVSALLVGSLAIQCVAAIAARVVFHAIIESNRGNFSELGLYLGALQLVAAAIRAICCVAIIAAIFGWRISPVMQAPLQFNIRGLILLTLAVAVLCGLGRVAAPWLGEIWRGGFIQLVDDIPVLVCLIVGIWIAIARWSRHPWVSQIAVVGLSLYLGSTTISQIIWLAAPLWFAGGGLPLLINVAFVLTIAASWAVVLTAALGWRELDSPFLPRFATTMTK